MLYNKKNEFWRNLYVVMTCRLNISSGDMLEFSWTKGEGYERGEGGWIEKGPPCKATFISQYIGTSSKFFNTL